MLLNIILNFSDPKIYMIQTMIVLKFRPEKKCLLEKY